MKIGHERIEQINKKSQELLVAASQEMWVDIIMNMAIFLMKDYINRQPQVQRNAFMSSFIEQWEAGMQNLVATNADDIYTDIKPDELDGMLPESKYKGTMQEAISIAKNRVLNVFADQLRTIIVKPS